MDAIVILTFFSFAFALILARQGRNELRKRIAEQEIKIALLNSENMELADEVHRFRGAWEAIAPKENEIHLTRIVRKPPSLDEQIIKMIREVGGC
jgi:hypothetical protein